MIMRGRRRWKHQAGCKKTHCHHDPVTSTFFVHLIASRYLSLFFWLHQWLYHRFHSWQFVKLHRPPSSQQISSCHSSLPPSDHSERSRGVPPQHTRYSEEVGTKTACSNPLWLSQLETSAEEANRLRKYKVPRHLFPAFSCIGPYLHFPPSFPSLCAAIPQSWYQCR